MTRSLHAALALSLLAAGCSFEAAEGGGALPTNTCAYNEDCTPDSRCTASMCVARSIDDSLRIVLEVTPPPQPDGLTPVTVALPAFEVESGSSTEDWILPAPVRVRGRIRNGDNVVEADITLTAKQAVLGLPPKVVTAAVTRTTALENRDYDFDLRVADEGEYTFRVQPKDTTLPPIERVVQIERGESIPDIDYSTLDAERTLVFESVAKERALTVRAHDPITGAPISSTATVDELNGTVVLRFASEPDRFRLVVRPQGAYEPDNSDTPGADRCDHDTPVLPTFSIDSTDLEIDGDMVFVSLPRTPARVVYAAKIDVCGAPAVDGTAEPATLPVTLRSTSLVLGPDDTAWTAEMSTDTEAALDRGDFRFCLDLFEGEYEVVVTPPESKPCEIFAERVIVPAAETGTFNGNNLPLKDAAQLTGALRTALMMPLAATTIGVQSLGRRVELEPDDAAITAFSRSRQTTTDENGAFSLAVDRGSYDVTVKPPAGSGYAWYVMRDVVIGDRQEFPNFIDMSSPIAIDAGISSMDGSTLAGAEVTAYAIVLDAQGLERAVAVGKAVADATGRFMLLLPTSVPEGWTSSGL